MNAIIPDFDPAVVDEGLADAVQRYLKEQEEVALVNDPVTGALMEYVVLKEES